MFFLGIEGVSLECLNVGLVKLIVDLGNLLHCLVGLQRKFLVVEVDQLVAETVHVLAETALTRHHVLVVVYVLVQVVPILQLSLCEEVVQLVWADLLADRGGLIGLIGLVDVPEFASDLVADHRLGHKLVVQLEVNLDSVDALARV